jgi:hypothetical protein
MAKVQVGVIMDINKRKTFHFYESVKSLTGSIMSYKDIIDEYNALTPPKRHYIYSKVHQVIKKMNISFDKAHPLLVVSINVLAAEENIDPAVVLLIYLDKKNKKAR